MVHCTSLVFLHNAKPCGSAPTPWPIPRLDTPTTGPIGPLQREVPRTRKTIHSWRNKIPALPWHTLLIIYYNVMKRFYTGRPSQLPPALSALWIVSKDGLRFLPGCTASMYQVNTPYTAASMISIIMERPRLKSSPSTGDWLIVLHWMPTPATSYSAKYLEPRPKAVVDIRDWERDEKWFLLRLLLCLSLSKKKKRNPMWRQQVKVKEVQTYSNALLKGSDLIVRHLFPDGHVHVGHVAEKVDDSSTGRGQLGFRVDNWHQKAGKHHDMPFLVSLSAAKTSSFLKLWDLHAFSTEI